MPEAMLVVDPDETRILQASRAALALLEISPGEGARLSDFCEQDVLARLQKSLEDTRRVSADGIRLQTKTRETTVSLVLSKHDQEMSPLLVVRFVDAAEDEKRRATRAEIASSACVAVVGQLAAAVGHEINNPAQVVRSCLEHLQDTGANLSAEELAELAEDALEGLERIETVTRELVPFASSSDTDFQAHDLNEIVSHALRIAHTELRHCAKVVVELNDRSPVVGSAVGLTQLIAALLLSIARRLPEDSQENTITIRTVAGKQVALEIECQADVQDRFFEELQGRLTHELGQHIPASAEWISILLCMQISLAHHGSLTVDIINQRHAKVCLILPLGDEATPTPPKRLLLVDDEELVLRSMSRMLKGKYEIEITTTGEQAVELILNNNYDVVVCDIMMPGLSGAGVYEKVAAARPALAKRMVFISGGTFTAKAKAFASSVEQPVLEKPIRQSDLCRSIEMILGDNVIFESKRS